MRLPTFYEQNLIPNWGTYYDISKKYITFAYMETRKIHSNISFKLILYCDENKNGTMHYFI